jgi:twitching motility two-component system response regulator PilG
MREPRRDSGSIQIAGGYPNDRTIQNHPQGASHPFAIQRKLSMAKILIADDSRLHVHLISGWLKERGFEVVVASDAIQAMVMATQCRPDAIILDISMPAGSGIDVLKKLKLSAKTKHISVLVVTGNAGSEMRNLVKRLGAVDLLKKPLDCDEFCKIVSGLTVGTTPSPAPVI